MPEISLGVLLFLPVRHLEQRILDAVVAAGYPITLAQARLLQRIDEDGSRLTDLAAAAQVTKQTAGYLVDQLQEAGYVERVPDPTDARARLVRITPHGAEMYAVALPLQNAIEEEWRAHLGDEAISQLRSSLEKLREIVDPWAPDPPASAASRAQTEH